MHIDVNNAFLSWTAVYLLHKGYKTDIRNIEAIIGGDESRRHGIVLAKSMVAKSRGVKTAETIRDAKRKCYNLKIFPPYYKLYKYMSHKLFDIISEYTPDIEVLSIDECFIDYSKIKNMYGDEIKFAYKLKKEIKDKLGFTVNIGVANNKLCAKMASDFLKPDRVHTLFDNEVKEKMYPLPIGKLFGVGKKTKEKLINLNIKTIGDLANTDPQDLYPFFKNMSDRLVSSAQGKSDSIIRVKKEERQGISNSTTLSYNLNSLDEIYKVLFKLVDNVCFTLRKSNRYTSVIGVTLKDKFFKSRSHQRKLLNATDDFNIIYEVAKKLVKELYHDDSIRLVGVSLNKLSSNINHQISLFDDDFKESNHKLDKIVDQINDSYGYRIIDKASLVNKK